jgi:primosomal protein N'
MNTYQVMVPVNLNKSFSYLSNEKLSIGDLVKIPFGKRYTIGLIVGNEEENINIKLKNINKKYFNIGKNNVKFINWIAGYNLSVKGMVFKSFISGADLIKEDINTEITKYKLSDDYEQKIKDIKITKARQEVIDFLEK